MRAVVQERYGSTDVFEVREIDMPAVQDDEVLVRVRAASVHLDVWHAVSGRPYALRLMGAGLRRPKNRIPGTDVAGTWSRWATR
jgi:NADPH:quinone reductase-like Zn-dependent oxidoreductase